MWACRACREKRPHGADQQVMDAVAARERDRVQDVQAPSLQPVEGRADGLLGGERAAARVGAQPVRRAGVPVEVDQQGLARPVGREVVVRVEGQAGQLGRGRHGRWSDRHRAGQERAQNAEHVLAPVLAEQIDPGRVTVVPGDAPPVGQAHVQALLSMAPGRYDAQSVHTHHPMTMGTGGVLQGQEPGYLWQELGQLGGRRRCELAEGIRMFRPRTARGVRSCPACGWAATSSRGVRDSRNPSS